MNNTLLFPGTCRQGPGCSTQAPLELLKGEPHLSVVPDCGLDADVLIFVFQRSIDHFKEESDFDL